MATTPTPPRVDDSPPDLLVPPAGSHPTTNLLHRLATDTVDFYEQSIRTVEQKSLGLLAAVGVLIALIPTLWGSLAADGGWRTAQLVAIAVALLALLCAAFLSLASIKTKTVGIPGASGLQDLWRHHLELTADGYSGADTEDVLRQWMTELIMTPTGQKEELATRASLYRNATVAFSLAVSAVGAAYGADLVGVLVAHFSN